MRQAEIELVILQRVDFKLFVFGQENNFLRSALGINSRRENFCAVVDKDFNDQTFHRFGVVRIYSKKINLRANLLLFKCGTTDFVRVAVDVEGFGCKIFQSYGTAAYVEGNRAFRFAVSGLEVEIIKCERVLAVKAEN